MAGYAQWHGWSPTMPLDATVGGIGAAAAIGILAGICPAVRAARLPPTEALATS